MRLLDDLISLISSKLNMASLFMSIFKLETRLAGLSVWPLLLTLAGLLVVAAIMWLSSMLLAGYGLYLLYQNLLLAIGVVWFIQIVMMIVLIRAVKFHLNNMSFQTTRKILSANRKRDTHVRQKKTPMRHQAIR